MVTAHYTPAMVLSGAAALLISLALMPLAAGAQLLTDGKGPVDAYNYNEQQLSELNLECGWQFECKPNDVQGVFFYNCYYDVKSAECQCAEGSLSQCNRTRSSLPAHGGFSLSTRGALGIATGAIASAAALPLLTKIGIGALILAIALLLYLRLRDSADNNLRTAKALHEKASALHEQGQEDEAKLLFEKANYHREKAYQQTGADHQ